MYYLIFIIVKYLFHHICKQKRKQHFTVVGNHTCPDLTAIVAQVAPAAERNALLAATCAKADQVLLKAESLFQPDDGKLFNLFKIYQGLSFLRPSNLRNTNIGSAAEEGIDLILDIPSLAAVPGLKAALMAELPQYFVLSENVANDVALLPWWFFVSQTANVVPARASSGNDAAAHLCHCRESVLHDGLDVP